MFWLDHTNHKPVASTLDQFARENGTPEPSKEGDGLKGFLRGGEQIISLNPHDAVDLRARAGP